MRVVDFDKLTKKDFENGAIINEIRKVIKEAHWLRNRNKQLERKLKWGENCYDREKIKN